MGEACHSARPCQAAAGCKNRWKRAPPLIELPDLLRATRAVENNDETLADLDYLRGRATSLGGLRPKCSVRDDAWGLCIGKFPSLTDERAVTKGEVLALHLARRANVDVADARLVDSDGIPVALVRRFDRVTIAGVERRLHYVSAATLLGFSTVDSSEHSYTEVADALRQRSADSSADLAELWRRIAFSILITNVDDHLHNHGFLHVDGFLWRLSPAFDVNPFPDRVRELKTWISEDFGPHASIEGLMGIARYFGLTLARAREILREVERSVSGWRAAATQLGMTRDEIDSFADAFEHEERVVTQRFMS